jgi:hypothetical protein
MNSLNFVGFAPVWKPFVDRLHTSTASPNKATQKTIFFSVEFKLASPVGQEPRLSLRTAPLLY